MSLKFARITAITAATLLACGGAVATGVPESAGAATAGSVTGQVVCGTQGFPQHCTSAWGGKSRSRRTAT